MLYHVNVLDLYQLLKPLFFVVLELVLGEMLSQEGAIKDVMTSPPGVSEGSNIGNFLSSLEFAPDICPRQSWELGGMFFCILLALQGWSQS